MDRGYQSHKNFDLLQAENKHFVCRIKTKTIKTIIKEQPVDPDSYIFYDAVVLLGTPEVNQTSEQIATVYKLRWDIEIFFKWWNKHLKVYHLIACSKYGLMV